MPGLQGAQQWDDKERLPSTPHLRPPRQVERGQILHETRRSMGIQQSTDQGGGPMEGRIQN